MECLMIALRSIRPALSSSFRWCLIGLIVCQGLRLSAQTPIVNDTTTQYTIPIQYASAPCWGTCDLSPSYNNYTAPSAFSITKITFNWSDGGGNNCDNIGHYGAVISSSNSAAGTLATSTNSVYMGCGGSSGLGELDFSGQIVPTSFYVDFHSVDGGLQGGASIAISSVEIWGTSLNASGVPQIGLPVLFIPGICEPAKQDNFLPAEIAVKTYLQTNAPVAYPASSSQEYVVYYDELNQVVQFQLPQKQLPSGSSNPPLDTPPTPAQFFLVALDDLGVTGYQNFNPSYVASIPIYVKGNEIAQIIGAIKQITGAPRVIVVGHSMGGLDARSYIEDLATPQFASGITIPYQNDIAALITLDTPHGGAETAEDNIPWAPIGCPADPSVDKSEMVPSGTDSATGYAWPSVIPALNYSEGNAQPLPQGLTVTSITSEWDLPTDPLYGLAGLLIGPGNDNILTAQEQDLASNLPNPSVNSQSSLIGVSNSFGITELTYTDCGIVEPLHLLTCTGNASQTFNILGPAVLASSVILSGTVQVTPSQTTIPNGLSVQFTSSAPQTIWSIREGSIGGTISQTGLYTAPASLVSVGSTFHVEAVNAASPNQYGEAAVTVTQIQPTQTPIITPSGGNYASAQSVTISDSTPGAVIYYSLNGSVPTSSSTMYTSAFTVNSSETVRAIAIAPSLAPSPIASASFTSSQSEPGIMRLTSDTSYDTAPAWSPTGSTILFVSGTSSGSNDDIFEVSADGSRSQQITSTNHWPFGGGLMAPVWLGSTGDVVVLNTVDYWDWMRLALSTNPALPISRNVLNGDSPDLTILLNIPGGLGGTSFAVSPDGTTAAWSVLTTFPACPSITDLRVSPFDLFNEQASSTNTGTSITTNNLNCASMPDSQGMNGISFSPDGSEVVVGESADPNAYGFDLYVYKLDGTFVSRLTNNGVGSTPVINWHPSWSSDNRIVFASNSSGRFEIWTINLDGTGLQQFSSEGGDSPTWSPDSSRIAFASVRDGNSQIYSVPAPKKILPVLTVTVNNASIPYGTSSPAITYTITGFVNGDTQASSTTGEPTLTTTATATSSPGTYPIAASVGSLAATNYTFQFVSGTLTISQAMPSLTWTPSLAISYGTALSGTQLNATATIPGSFIYTPVVGTVLGAGTQTLSVTFTPTDTTDYTTATDTISITVTPATPPFGSLEVAVDSVTGSTTVSQADSVRVSGWIADQTDGAPLGNVKVYIDGTLVGTPTLGLARADVAAAFSNAAFTNSGFQLLYSAGTLTVGTHAVTVVAIDSGSRSTTFGPRSITVIVPPPPPPFGGLERAVDSLTGSTTVSQADSVRVSGWVADQTDGAPLSNVKVYIDGALVGTPTLGLARPDVAAAYSNAAYTNSGYQLLYSAATLSVGTHAVTVIAIDSGSRSTTFGPLTITVTSGAAPPPPPFGSLEKAVDSTTSGTTVSQSDSVQVSGWVADKTDGAPLSNVKVYIDGTLVGTPTLGLARPDVAGFFSNVAYTNSGYQLLYSASTLSVGSHAVTMVAIDSGSRSTTFGPLTITVTAGAAPPPPPFGTLERAVDSVTGSTTVLRTGSVAVSGWVADKTDGAPLSNVKVYIDGTLVGTPTLGLARPDVAAFFSNVAYTNSGYQLLYSASTLSVGSHAVTMVAIDSGSRSTTFGPLTVTVQ
jgi:Tol biopolymer transport system component